MRRERPDRPLLPGHGQMEDYTAAFLVAAWVLCFFGLLAIWAAWGFAVAIVISAAADYALQARAARRSGP
ncbi:MAG: hypothetical protein AAGG54_12400 [Pseudomonadota bacterium]